MRKIKYLFGICAVLALFACNSEDKELKQNVVMYGTYISNAGVVDTEGEEFVMLLRFVSKSWSFGGDYAKFVDVYENITDHFFSVQGHWKIKEQKIFLYKDRKEVYSGNVLENGRVLLLVNSENNIITFTAQ